MLITPQGLLKINKAFSINDHIGTMMCDVFDQSLNLYMVDWNVSIYSVRARGTNAIADGTSLSDVYRFRLTESYEYQDCKQLGGHFFLCAGKEGGVLGVCKPGRLVIIYADVQRAIYLQDEPNSLKYSSVPFQVVREFRVPFVSPGGKLSNEYRIGYIPFTYNATEFDVGQNDEGEEVVLLYGTPQDGKSSHLITLEVPLNTSRN